MNIVNFFLVIDVSVTKLLLNLFYSGVKINVSYFDTYMKLWLPFLMHRTHHISVDWRRRIVTPVTAIRRHH